MLGAHEENVGVSAPTHPPPGQTSALPRRASASGALLLATAAWGSTFVVTKSSLPELAPASFLLWRFGIAAVVLLLVSARRTFALPSTDLRRGVALGVTSGPGASLTAGALLTLIGALAFAGHITALSEWATPANALGVTTVSVAVATVLCGAAALVTGDLSAPRSVPAWASVLYVALIATCVGLAVQAWAQGALSAVTAAVIMTMEPVFAAVLAVGVGGESLAPAAWVGGLVVVTAMGVAELGARACCDVGSPRVDCC